MWEAAHEVAICAPFGNITCTDLDHTGVRVLQQAPGTDTQLGSCQQKG